MRHDPTIVVNEDLFRMLVSNNRHMNCVLEMVNYFYDAANISEKNVSLLLMRVPMNFQKLTVLFKEVCASSLVSSLPFVDKTDILRNVCVLHFC
jgi:ABC-type phosphate/phosphonate transport system substrate-binding protein